VELAHENHGEKLKQITPHFKKCQIHGEFTAAIHSHIVLIKHPTETFFTP